MSTVHFNKDDDSGARAAQPRSVAEMIASALRGVAASGLGTLAMDALLYGRYRTRAMPRSWAGSPPKAS